MGGCPGEGWGVAAAVGTARVTVGGGGLGSEKFCSFFYMVILLREEPQKIKVLREPADTRDSKVI